jgi:hypothetical protein
MPNEAEGLTATTAQETLVGPRVEPRTFPPTVPYPEAEIAATAAEPIEYCDPRFTSATEWGEPAVTRKGARANARAAAREAAAEACEEAECPGGGKCRYVESSIEILETSVIDPENGGAVTFESRAKSSGSCVCVEGD